MIQLRVDTLAHQVQTCFKNASTAGRKGLSLQNPPLADPQEVTLVREVLVKVKKKRDLLTALKATLPAVKDPHVQLLQKELLVLEKERFPQLLQWMESLLPESKKGFVLQGTSIQNAVARELNFIALGCGSAAYYLNKGLPALPKEKILAWVEEFNAVG